MDKRNLVKAYLALGRVKIRPLSGRQFGIVLAFILFSSSSLCRAEAGNGSEASYASLMKYPAAEWPAAAARRVRNTPPSGQITVVKSLMEHIFHENPSPVLMISTVFEISRVNPELADAVAGKALQLTPPYSNAVIWAAASGVACHDPVRKDGRDAVDRDSIIGSSVKPAGERVSGQLTAPSQIWPERGAAQAQSFSNRPFSLSASLIPLSLTNNLNLDPRKLIDHSTSRPSFLYR